jgi:hypothetical protein
MLSENNEYATDALLVFLVKVQLIVNKVALVDWTDASSQPFFRETFKYQLDEVKQSVPLELQSNSTSIPHS